MVQIRVRKEDAPWTAMQTCIDLVLNAVDEDTERNLSDIFWDLPSKKDVPDYYDVISSPMALSIIQAKVTERRYVSFQAFIREMAQIFHNAKTYNRRSSVVYEDAATLETMLIRELNRLKDQRHITREEAVLPVLGPAPPASPQEESMDDDSADDDDDDDEEEEEEGDGLGRRRRRKRTRKVKSLSPAGEEDEDEEARARRLKREDYKRKRGRPPRVDTPNEARIKNIIKGIRKERDRDGRLLFLAFERLPDVKQYPEYFQEIRDPIALDGIRKKVKRRQYRNLDMFLADTDLMYGNAMRFNADDSVLYHDAIRLQQITRELTEQERRKDDSEFINFGTQDRRDTKQVRIPQDGIIHKGVEYRVGDWVHIINPNDASKPTIAQIFRTWKTTDGQLWVNACWYYRPELTVHSNQKTFLEHEVVKSGQYRDHHIDEILDHCFVMFFTRFARGRPQGYANKAIYVCEARYNEIEKTFNKIKTWKSCIPDEVRGGDYEMYLYERVRQLRRVPSPLLHLLPPDASDDDPIPEAVQGVEGAPPKLGAIYKRPFDPTEPPVSTKEASPVRMAIPPTPSAGAAASNGDGNRSGYENLTMSQMYKQAHAGPSSGLAPSGIPGGYMPTTQLQFQQQQQQLVRSSVPPSTFTYPSLIDLPLPTTELLQRDAMGEVLWFGVPPLDPVRPARDGQVLGHTVAYLSRRKRPRQGAEQQEQEQGADPGQVEAGEVREMLLRGISLLPCSLSTS